MTNHFDIGNLRLCSLGIEPQKFKSVQELIKNIGALQAQDYDGAKWSIGLRLHDSQASMIDQAIADKIIVRTWPMRGTLHFVPADDVRWMLGLMTPRILSSCAKRHQQLELSPEIFTQSRKIFTQALQGGHQVSRDELLQKLELAGISTKSQRGYHILWWHAQHELICFAETKGKQHYFALCQEWLPKQTELTREESLAIISKRFFNSHGPATQQDLMRWTGLNSKEVQIGIAQIQSDLYTEKINGQNYWMSAIDPPQQKDQAFLLPGFDEFILGYKDRDAVLAPADANQICPGNNGMFKPTVIINGQVCGIWQRKITKKKVTIQILPFRPLTQAEKQALQKPTEAYGRFLGLVTDLIY